MNGDSFHQHGAGSIGKAEHSGSGDIVAAANYTAGPESAEAALKNLLLELQKLRQHLDAQDQFRVDAAAGEITANPRGERLKELLRTISGIAVLVGDVGAPVINAVKAVLGTV
ncbi:hypothetical protein [Streptomyces sp. NPDC008150]|uniref:hypothetical protein n=1 Tax=Streptomyces sp. NPDC008150 TaxID=3364816 RepID=UPI0036E64229